MKNRKAIATNKKAYHDYFVDETYEAGLVLTGSEVKSIREGRVNLRDTYAIIRQGEAYLLNMHIGPYSHTRDVDYNPTRTRKILLHKHEIRRLIGKTKEKGYTLVPLKVYFANGYAKVEIGLVKGKKLFDKRREIAKKEAQRDMERQLKDSQKSKVES